MVNEKPKVIGEELDNHKVKRFLAMRPHDNSSIDFHILTKAYRGLPPEPFSRFLKMFVEDGRDVNAKSENGQTFVETLSLHKSQGEYIEILKRFGAK